MTHCWLDWCPGYPFASFCCWLFGFLCASEFHMIFFFVKSQWNSSAEPRNQATVAWDCLRHQPLFLPVDKYVHSCWLSSPNFCWEAVLSSRVTSTRPNWYPCYASIRTMCVLNPSFANYIPIWSDVSCWIPIWWSLKSGTWASGTSMTYFFRWFFIVKLLVYISRKYPHISWLNHVQSPWNPVMSPFCSLSGSPKRSADGALRNVHEMLRLGLKFSPNQWW